MSAQPTVRLEQRFAVSEHAGRPALRVGLSALIAEIERRYPCSSHEPHGRGHVLRTGQPELTSEFGDDLLRAIARDAEHLELMRALGLTSRICVPLLARGRTIGAITFVTFDSDRRYGARDLALMEELARRTALAVDNARLYHGAKEALKGIEGLFDKKK